jgi:drug/metabolite transporter (DMT)-like permease
MTAPVNTHPPASSAEPTGAAAFFGRPRNVVLLATLCCLLWGSAYPAIKSGYALLAIGRDDTAAQLVFAGYRFVLAGLLLLGAAAAMGRPVLGVWRQRWRQLGLLGLTQTSVQYVFFYVGLAHTTGVKASIFNGTATFFSVLLAHAIYANDRLSQRKLLGCGVGFGGVLVVNLLGGQGMGSGFNWLGDGFIVVAALVLSAASIYGKRLSQAMDPMVMTGYQLALGGAALVLVGALAGGSLQGWRPASASLLVYMALLSAVAFGLWAALLKHNRVGTVTVFNFLVPIFGAVLSAIFLGEEVLAWRNLIALALVCLGIWLVTTEAAAAPSRAG